jgi:hypothetical protein
MKTVYVGGPFRGKNHWDIEQNVRRAEQMALGIWATKRAAALCPHTMCRYYQGALEDEVWEIGLLELMKRCDALLLVDGWENSEGTLAEIKLAKECGIPIFESFNDCVNWIMKDM